MMNGHVLAESWERDGWLHLSRFFSPAVIAEQRAIVNELWRSKPSDVIVDDLDLRQRCRMSRLTDLQRVHRIKLNDLYLSAKAVRELVLEPRVITLLERLLDDRAVLCNTLHLERSSAQEYHADSLYMTPPTPGRLVAAWIALEDVVEGSGP